MKIMISILILTTLKKKKKKKKIAQSLTQISRKISSSPAIYAKRLLSQPTLCCNIKRRSTVPRKVPRFRKTALKNYSNAISVIFLHLLKMGYLFTKENSIIWIRTMKSSTLLLIIQTFMRETPKISSINVHNVLDVTRRSIILNVTSANVMAFPHQP